MAPVRVTADISIHSLHTEGDFLPIHVSSSPLYFNPLPPHGGRPVVQHRMRRCRRHFNPLPPHGGRPSVTSLFVLPGVISIHSLRMEGDGGKMTGDIDMASFQSTPSARRETFGAAECAERTVISIHSLHTEGDLYDSIGEDFDGLFQSTPSTRRETWMRLIRRKLRAYFNPLPPHGGRP